MNRTVEQLSESKQRPRHCLFLPRFGLRTLLIVGLVFCLLFGWIGRNLYRVRQEDAAIEALLRAGGRIELAKVPGAPGWSELIADPAERTASERLKDQILRSIDWRKRPAIASVDIGESDPNDPATAKALASLERLPEIESVGLAGSGVDDSAVSALDELPHLTRLTLAGTRITGRGLARLTHPERLRALEILDHPAQAEILSEIRSFENLKTLRVTVTYYEEDVAQEFASLFNQQNIEPIDERGDGSPKVAPLAVHPRSDRLSPSRFSEEEIDALATMSKLENLWINGASDADLQTLARSSSLRKLVVGHPATEDAVRRLSNERAGWTIFFLATSNTALQFGGRETGRDPWPFSIR